MSVVRKDSADKRELDGLPRFPCCCDRQNDFAAGVTSSVDFLCLPSATQGQHCSDAVKLAHHLSLMTVAWVGSLRAFGKAEAADVF